MKRKIVFSFFYFLLTIFFVHGQSTGTFSYNFADGSILPQTSYQSLRYAEFVSADEVLTLKSNTSDEARQFGYHDSSHGAVFFPGNSIEFLVAANATITILTCQYGSANDAIFEFTDSNGNVLGSTSANNIGAGAAGTGNFSYSGEAGKITGTLLSESFPTAEIYIHGVIIENAAEIITSNGLIDVWDFGAEQLDETEYNNMLNESIINSWYNPSIEVGSSGNVLPGFSAGVLSWVGGGNDRLRTNNTNLTRYDENLSGVSAYSGRIYVNSSSNTGRYISLSLSEDDEVAIMAISQNGNGQMNFEFVGNPQAQTDVVPVYSDITEVNFVAKYDGTYHIFDTQDKPSYYRIYRKDASYVTITGNVDVSNADGISGNYGIAFTNEAGKVYEAILDGESYSITVPSGYTYGLSLLNANGYIIESGISLDVSEETTSSDISIIKIELYNLSGTIDGLGDAISDLELTFIPDPSENKIFEPEVDINYEASTYSVLLESDCEYTIAAQGVNDYYIPENKITIDAEDGIAEISFLAKETFGVTINANGLTAEQLDKLKLTFTNLTESGYVYEFNSVNDIALRNGTYAVEYSGLDEYALKLSMTSNVVIDGAAVEKLLTFSKIIDWTFDDKVIANGTTSYNGLIFSGSVQNEIAKGHLVTKEGSTIKVPVEVGDKITVTYYYSADISFEGGESYITESGSTSTLEYAEYSYQGTEAGYVEIEIGGSVGTTYITNIAIGGSAQYQEFITVGADKTYTSINDALNAVSKMVRDNSERVTIMIDPGNYEEMLVVDIPNVTFKNAAVNPSISLKNSGVDIDDSAVRITSYYGHGYNYYSMASNQKWDAEILRVNKENGYLSYENKGSGTTNGSFWNATVVVSADGFEAEGIIFENSFNQYISKKESEDVVVMWESGSKGERPTNYGNTAVQDKSFVERAAALAITNNTDKIILNRCRVVGHQDSFFGGYDSRVVVYKGAMMGGTDYLFGGMIAVFYKTDLVMLTSDDGNDVSYLTAAQQSSGRGYLMYECTIKSAIPGIENNSTYLSKPGYYGRPWQATTSEVVFYNTTIETTDFPGSEGISLIKPIGWLNSLGGESEMMYEYGTTELSGEDNLANRASWSTILDNPVLSDGTEITTFNFTKGNDNWDPIPALIESDKVGIQSFDKLSAVSIFAHGEQIEIKNVQSRTNVEIYNLNGSLVKSFHTSYDQSVQMHSGLWIVKIKASDGIKVVKVITD